MAQQPQTSPSILDLQADGFVTPELALPQSDEVTEQTPQHKDHRASSLERHNAFNLFSKRGDPNESRYNNKQSQAEGDVNMPFSDTEMRSLESATRSRAEPTETNGSKDQTTPQLHQQQSSVKRSATFFGRNGSQPEVPRGTDGIQDDSKKARKLLTLFRKRNRDRDRWPTLTGLEDPESSEDGETGERAHGLINSLALGSPAINLLASCLCEDEYGIARAPLLMNLLGIKVTDISSSPLTKNKKLRIDLEYGVWPQRLKWSVEKTAKDLLYLHSRFKWLALTGSLKSVALPRYPVPPLLKRNERRTARTARALGDAATSALPVDSQTTDAHMHDNNSILSGQSFRDRLSTLRAHFSGDSSDSSLSSTPPEQLVNQVQTNQRYVKEIEKYLIELNVLVAMRPQSNRLFQFFEISPISSLLTYETGYIGKQGVIHVGGTAKSQGWRVGHFKANDLKQMIDRRSEKWFLVRGSYVMYVSDINSTTPLDVFLVDSSFRFTFKRDNSEMADNSNKETDSMFEDELKEKIGSDGQAIAKVQNKVFKHLRIIMENNERKLVVIPKSKVEQQMWIASLNEMVKGNVWAQKHRFGSFAPVRKNCFAQWLVDARDYFWAISSALEMAKDTVFIHDWWLSPELYLRRPANGNQQFRLDRILQRKAQQGVKVFVILYRNVGTTIPIDSLYSKHSILSLNQDNIHVIRSPNQLLQNTYFWAHHEKLCVIDYNIAFMGGIDLCYGRYDTPDHVLEDDSNLDFETIDPANYKSDDFSKFRIFPGKDYSNTRVKDFSNLNKPYESLYDRNIVPRMPWHDVHMMTSGEPARDLARHFVQRWNYLLRQKRPSRPTPLLTPPPDLSPEMVENLNLGGSCEVQIIRSSGNWSLGLKDHEQSIQDAYLKIIEASEHFVYIENQFFVTSCFIDGTEIKNRIGDALVDRIIRAYREGKSWKAIIIIPLVPGFESQVDEIEGSSVRVVMQCEYMSISRGASSLFAKLRKAGIDPDDYIQFFSLRKWGAIGPNQNLVTEQLYIHAKLIIADDRVAIIGSANINERSMRGSRDSELAAIVRDTHTIQSTMNGGSYKVGKFAHSLRLRLMREHLGVAVDLLDIVERRFEAIHKFSRTEDGLKAMTNDSSTKEGKEMSAAVELASRFVLSEPSGTSRWKAFWANKGLKGEIFEVPKDIRFEEAPEPMSLPLSFNNRTGPHEANVGIRDRKKHSFDPRVQNNLDHQRDVFGEGTDQYRSESSKRARLDSARFLRKLAHESFEKHPDQTFLPDIHLVKEFLNSNDDQFMDSPEEDLEEILFARNEERLLLLKKIAYLQLVAARTAKQSDIYQKKRAMAGLPATVSALGKKTDLSNVSKDVSKDTTRSSEVRITSEVNVKNGNTLDRGDNIEVSTDKDTHGHSTSEPYSEEIPVVSLDEAAFRDTIRKINSPGLDNFGQFIDPYCFNDPLDPDFYEDIWFENARRNTDIFRLIFHCQPDDAVPSWKEYMKFMKLSKAFRVGQDEDAKHKREKRSSDLDNTDHSSEENARPLKRSERTSVNINGYSNEEDILGDLSSVNAQVNNGNKNEKNNLTLGEPAEDHSETDSDSEEDSGTARQDSKEMTDISKEDESPKPQEGDFAGHDVPRRNAINRKAKKRRAGTFSARRKIHAGQKIFDRDSAERILQEVHGHLVLFPVDWLQRELEGGNWFFNTDRIPPIEIYD